MLTHTQILSKGFFLTCRLSWAVLPTRLPLGKCVGSTRTVLLVKLNYMQNGKELRYIMYCRKSTDSEDRQIQSIEDQREHLRMIQKTRELSVVKCFEESMSAKRAGRPLFNQALKMIQDGEADGIPGLIVDRYLTQNHQVFVAQAHTAGANKLLEFLCHLSQQSPPLHRCLIAQHLA